MSYMMVGTVGGPVGRAHDLRSKGHSESLGVTDPVTKGENCVKSAGHPRIYADYKLALFFTII